MKLEGEMRMKRLTFAWKAVTLMALLTVGALLLAAAPASAIQFERLGAEVTDLAGDPARQAGSHPDIRFEFVVPPKDPNFANSPPLEQPHRLRVDLPPGLVGNPLAAPTCHESGLKAGLSGNQAFCPVASQVGFAKVYNADFVNPLVAPVYNIEPPDTSPAMFAFNVLGTVIRLTPTVRPGDFGITLDSGEISQGLAVNGADVTIWGIPADPLHDVNRFGPIAGIKYMFAPASSSDSRKPFISTPTHCPGTPDVTTAHLDGRANVGQYVSRSFSADFNDVPFINGDCDRLSFDPSVSVQPSSGKPGAPTGLEFNLTVPQNDASPDGLATAHVRDVTVTLPEGMVISPSAAAGLGSCTDAQIGLNTTAPSSCPDSSKIGTAEVETGLLRAPMKGNVYLGSQESDDPASGKMFRTFLEIAGSGVRVKLEGGIGVDPATGRLTASFKNNPQLPFDKLNVSFDRGPGAPLVTPKQCGVHSISVEVTSWAGHSRDLSDAFNINGGDVGAPCPTADFDPGFRAGSSTPEAGSDTSFSMAISRQADDHELKAIKHVTMPEGLLARVGSVPLCDATTADSGACGEASRVGHVQLALGAGPSPLWVPQAGKKPTAVYLTGEYRDAPYGLSIVVPAQAGPFDLGSVVVRAALRVDERTTQIDASVEQTRIFSRAGALDQVIEGELPRMLRGIVIDQRQLRVIVDRPGFMVNPTDCSPMQVAAELISFGDASAKVANRFRAADCARLGFAPRFNARILDKGRRSTLRSFHPRTRFAVVPRKGDANIGGARVVLPSSTLLDQANIGTTCTRAQMAERACPAGSVVGFARAWSPLLRKAVEGPVYLAANGGVRPLPDLAAVLDGEIRVVLQGEIATQRSGGKARLQNTFRVVPDAPVSRFVLTMRGGKNRGLLVNSTDLCRTNERGVAVFHGQNGRTHRLRPRITTAFKGCVKVRRQAARRKVARRQAALTVARRTER